MFIKLPPAFKAKLEEDVELTIIVNQAIMTAQKIYSDSLYFFPEYTDHGAEHISSVLEVSVKLITPATLETILSPTDIGLLVLSVLFHDIGMHLSYDGFKQLIKGNYDPVMCTEFDTQTWFQLWGDFLVEAKRFSSKQLKATFGNENATIEIPDENLNTNQRLLIGEFLRRHHARLAHEIAIIGFPGVDDCKIDLTPALSVHERDLAGVIARSHGTHIRKTYAHIKGQFHSQAWKHPGNTYAFFLMVVLRIADYMQIDKTRTSDLTLKLRSFSSPVSTIEHNKHLSVKLVQYSGLDDREMLLVEAYPRTSAIYLRLKELVTAIQMEIDVSWAILGEIYGKDDERNRPEIQYRRITSNIEEETFTLRQDYVADKFVFDTDPDIVKMLIAPLYGNKPRFGIRELIQNSVDACNEMEFIAMKELQTQGYNGKITITVNRNAEGIYFEIQDNGKGMTIEEIRNYFLRTASSYRKSLGWKKKFINKDGETSLQKVGRFGIGVLASFLLGNELEVWTSHYQAEKGKGLYFKCMIEDENIEVVKINNCPEMGTRIRIKLEEGIFTYLTQFEFRSINYKWFAFSNPKLTINIYGREYTPFKPEEIYPHFEADPGPDWLSFRTKEFRKILWGHAPRLLASAYLLNCNGIDICKDYGFTDPILKPPKLVVFDFEARLPLTIDRNHLNEDLPFIEELKWEICKKIVAKLLSYDALKGRHFDDFCFKDNLPADDFLGNYKSIIRSSQGFILNYQYFWDHISDPEKKLIVIDGKINIEECCSDHYFISQGERHNMVGKADLLLWPEYHGGRGNQWNIQEFSAKKVCEKDHVSGNIWDKDLLNLFHRYSNSIFSFALFKKIPPINIRSGVLDKCLQEYLGDNPLIPHNMEDRKHKFPTAFKELKYFM